MVDFTIDQIFGMIALLSYILVIFLFLLVIVVNRRLKKILHIIEPLKKLQEESHVEKSLSQDEKFLKETREKPWDVEKDNYTDSESKFGLAPVEDETVETPEQIVIQKPPLVDLSDKFVDDVLSSAKELALSEQIDKRERKKTKTPTKTTHIVETEEKEPDVVVETEPAPHM